MRTVTVIGSVNIDLVASTPTLPRAGETVLATDFETSFGGKGANQAIAAARMGAQVRFVGCVGGDEYGSACKQNLARHGVDVRGVRTVRAHTGLALIALDARGRNQITVVAGANAHVHARGSHDIVLMQLETPFEVPRAKLFVLNPAPARKVSLRTVDIVIPNEIEAEKLTGHKNPKKAALALERAGAGRAIITLGARGVFADGVVHAGFKVKAIDTIGAGDAFCGAFVAALALQIDDPIAFAQACAALKVARKGAQSLPTRAEVERLLARKRKPA